MNHFGIVLLLVAVAAAAHVDAYRSVSDDSGKPVSDKSERAVPADPKKVVPVGIKRYARQECAPAGTPCDYLGRGSGGFTNCCSKMCMQQATDPVGGGHCT